MFSSRNLATNLHGKEFRLAADGSHGHGIEIALVSPMPLLQSSRDILTIPMRVALALGFLSSVVDRCGFLGPPGTPGVAWGNFANFLTYSAAVNSFAPSMVQLALAITATILEGLLGVLLLTGLYTQLAALVTSILLLSFAAAMTISLGIKPCSITRFFRLCVALCSSRPKTDIHSASMHYSLSNFGDHHHGNNSNNECDPQPPSRWFGNSGL